MRKQAKEDGNGLSKVAKVAELHIVVGLIFLYYYIIKIIYNDVIYKPTRLRNLATDATFGRKFSLEISGLIFFAFFLRKNLEKGKCLTYLCIVVRERGRDEAER